MKYKLLALDIDETLVSHSSDKVEPSVYSALQKASEKLTITFVTARGINDFQPFLDSLNLPQGYHVVENGAKVLNPEGQVVYDLPIPHSEVQDLLDATKPFSIEVGFLVDAYWVDDPDQYQSESTVTGLSFTCISDEQALHLKRRVEEFEHQYTVYVGPHYTKNPAWRMALVFHKDATKGKGMRFIQEKLGITPAETIAVGDGSTDVSMFEVAGLKVAVANAVPEMKSAADIIIPSVQENGIVEFIEKNIC